MFLGVSSVFAATSSEVEERSEAGKTSSAKNVVLAFQDELIAVMQQGEVLGFKGRYDKLEMAIIKSHDLTKIARIVVGKEWKNLSNEQKSTLTDVFSRLSVSAYAYNFKAFSGESFDYVSADETARGGVIIHTVFVLPDDKDVKFDYMLTRKGDNWRIINIIANGVSDLALKRSEYTSVLKRQGFEALIAKINEKIDNYAKQ
ncbi:MAG: hopanoid biosynthesis protein HpnM [Methylomarinum sp.]|nr:ABC transporter substrate-binding protein [Methylococcales bacterium]NOR72091.1 hopanoid biosynthesis protein HpnM [Methylomarinum sp.]